MEHVARSAPDGYTLAPGLTAQFGDYIRSEIVKWQKVVRDSGAKID